VQADEVSLGQRISLHDVFVGVLWFLPISVLVLVLLIFFPGIAELVPNLSRQ
jgi:C4-dicarboxylate transporter, DctM subunit